MPTPFIQLIGYHTDRPDAVDDLLSRWIAASVGKRTPGVPESARTSTTPTRYVEILEFDSADDAMTKLQLPETNAVHEQFTVLCTASRPPTPALPGRPSADGQQHRRRRGAPARLQAGCQRVHPGVANSAWSGVVRTVVEGMHDVHDRPDTRGGEL